MKKPVIGALVMALALSAPAAWAQTATQSDVYRATVLSVEEEALLLSVEEVEPEDAAFPENELQEDSPVEPEEEPVQTPSEQVSLAARSPEEEAMPDVLTVYLREDTQVWLLEDETFTPAEAQDIVQGDELILRVEDGEATEIVIQPREEADQSRAVNS